MQPYQQQFIEFILEHKALLFGEFTLKSGRISPYFFNSGVFNTGESLAKLSFFYAAAIQEAKDINFDVLFGPAYKGIPLVCSTAIALHHQYRRNVPYCFNRKEEKKHGEGGKIVGAPLSGRVLIIDDVISAGTAVRESMNILQEAKAPCAGVVVSFDRQERGQGNLSAIQEIKQNYHCPVISVSCLAHLIEYISEQSSMKEVLVALKKYQQQYGAK